MICRHAYTIGEQQSVQLVKMQGGKAMQWHTRMIGTAAVIGLDKPSPMLVAMHVTPEYRRQGVGSEILQEAIEEVRHARRGRLFAQVDAANVDAVRFYMNHGFKITSRPIDADGRIVIGVDVDKRSRRERAYQPRPLGF